jgi:WD40 repeat protein
VRWSPTGEYLATLSHNSRKIFLYGITGRHRVQQWLTGHRVELKCVAAHPRREWIVTSGTPELNSWGLSASRPSPVTMEPDPAAVYSVAYSPDGSLLATASTSRVMGTSDTPKSFILIRDGSTGKVRSRISQPQIVSAQAFDPTDERLVCGDLAGHVVAWDLVTSRPVQRFDGFQWSGRSSILTVRAGW